jgi:hypothetical protein
LATPVTGLPRRAHREQALEPLDRVDPLALGLDRLARQHEPDLGDGHADGDSIIVADEEHAEQAEHRDGQLAR